MNYSAYLFYIHHLKLIYNKLHNKPNGMSANIKSKHLPTFNKRNTKFNTVKNLIQHMG